ncbi:MAG: purine-nucleoside phosphorylase [Cellulomonadaceae bacterium]|jgi:purine-nucleoside phosphorylase|nr:purine-nucleoside phosphorylase [Cellulomonadaceae bacterium]
MVELTSALNLDDASTDPMDVAKAAADFIATTTGVAAHDVALVLGSGWGGAADILGTVQAEFPTHEIPGFSKPAVEGHGGTTRSIAVTREDGTTSNVLVIGSRTHYYEGKGVRRVAHGVRTAAAAGCKVLVLTNGCGGLNTAWKPGQVVLLRDQINFTGATALEGATFVDLTDLYSQRLRDVAHTVDPTLPEGVYMQFPGPQYETPAEVRMAGIMGADLVGMSTAIEAIAARGVGLEILGLSLMTNLGAGIQSEALSHAEVLEAGQAAGPRIAALLADIVRVI